MAASAFPGFPPATIAFLEELEQMRGRLVRDVTTWCRTADAFMEFLCDAVEVPYR